MFETLDLADNALAHLHNEHYDVPYNLQNLNHENYIMMAGRETESLNGKWRFALDLHDTGLRAKWFELTEMDPEKKIVPYDYDPFMGEEITVPSCWQMEREKWFYYEGTAWYNRHFNYNKPEEAERLFLRIGAVNYDCKIFLNNKFVGNHYGGSTPIFAEFTEHLKEGKNWLMICANNERRNDRIPMRNTDWFNYGGIFREIELFKTPLNYIKDLFVYLEPNDQYNTIQVQVEAVGAVNELYFSIPELQITETISIVDGEGSLTINAKPELWSPDSPKLYDVYCTMGTGSKEDKIADSIGFRQIKVIGTDIQLNGKSIYLKGINAHEEDEKFGRLTSELDIRRRFQHAKELNCNYMRLAHYPHHEMASKIADEMGIMLWEEIPVYWSIDFENPSTIKDAKNQMLELVKRDRNRASVIIWSVGNENADTDARLKFMSNLVCITKRYDPSRLLSAACLVNHVKMKIEDRLAEHLDIIGLNEYYGWYEENFDDLIRLGENSSPTKPVVITETGADGILGENAPKHGAFSIEHMTKVYEKQTEYLPKLNYVRGFTPWLLYDFRAERRQNAFQKGWNCKGLIGADKRTKKPAFYVLKSFYESMK